MATFNQVSESISSAIIALANDDKQTYNLYQDLSLLKKFYARNNELLNFLNNPWIEKEEKINDIMSLKNDFSYDKTVNFLAFIAKSNAVSYFSKIIDLTIKELEEELGIVHLKIYSAFDLNDAQIKQIEDAIKKQDGLLPDNFTNLITEFAIDKEMIGGIKISINSKVIDNSLLQKIKQAKIASKTVKNIKE